MESVLTPPTEHSGEEPLMGHYEFEPLKLQHKKLSCEEKCYRVYRSADDYVEVDAESAYEAMVKSKITQPSKIARYSIRDLGSLTSEMMADEVSKTEKKEKATSSSDKPKAKAKSTKAKTKK